MLVEKIQELVSDINTANGNDLWQFTYGSDAWQNLEDVENDDLKPFAERGKYLKLLWVDENPILNTFSGIDGYTFDGELVLCVTSRLTDPEYIFKYETHIKKVKEECYNLLNLWVGCGNWNMTNWKLIEVSNLYDENMDGIKIKFTAKL